APDREPASRGIDYCPGGPATGGYTELLCGTGCRTSRDGGEGILQMAALQENDYCFAAVEEAPGAGARERSVALEIRAYDADARQHFQSLWKRLYAALKDHHKFCGRAAPAWTAWSPWDWCEEKKPGYEGRVKYVAWCGDVPVGFLNVWDGFPCVHQAPKTA